MKRASLLLPLLSITFFSIAQTNGSQFSLPAVIPNAPQAASLGRYGDIPVSVNTGVAGITVPLYTIQSGKLSVPVSIGYHSSGIKVMDQASSVGLGWSLSTGGDIARVIQGIPGEEPYGGFSLVRFPDINDPSLQAKEKCLASNICNTYDGLEPWDGQPDMYYYTIGGKSGQFIPKNAISTGLPTGFMTIPYEPIQVSYCAAGPGVYMPGIQITDVDGTQYTFMPYDSTMITPCCSATIRNSATAWHLQKILSADKADSITFQYGMRTLTWYTTNSSRLLNRNFDANGNPDGYSYTTPSGSTTDITEYLVSEIDFNNGKMVFNYSSGLDPSNSTRLDTVHVYAGSAGNYNEVRRFNLFHSAFQSPSNGSTSYALRLDSLQEAGFYNNSMIAKPSYVFSYYSYSTDAYTTYQCPVFNSNAQDFWGYFNGKLSNQDLTFVDIPSVTSLLPPSSAAYKRKPDSNYLKVGTLQSIRYPTGGTTTFDFEPNQKLRTYQQMDTNYSYLSGGYVTTFNEAPGNITMTTVTFTLNINLTTQLQSNGQTYNAKLDFTGSPVCTSSCVSNDPIVKLDDITTGVNILTVELSQLNNTNPPSLAEQISYLTLVTGHTYKLYFPNPGTLTGSQTFANLRNRLDATLSGQGIASITSTPVTETVLTGGLRIRKVTSSDANGKTLIKEYKYTGSYYNSNLFNGDFDDLALNYYTFDGWNLYAAKDDKGCALYGKVVTHYASNLCLSLGASTNNSISYNEVEEYESDGNEHYNGKTVYDYNQAQDFIPITMPFFKISNESARGLLIEKRIYKSVAGGYSLVQDVSDTYEDLNTGLSYADSVIFYTAHALVDNYVTKQGSPGSGVIGGPAFACLGCTNFDMQTKYLVNRYYYTTTRLVKASTHTSEYDNNGNVIASQVLYDYQNPVHAFPTHQHTINSDGKSVDQYTNYVLDYPASASCSNNCISNLKQQLAVINTGYFNVFGTAFNKFNLYQSLTGASATPMCSPNNPDSVISYESAYAQSLVNYQHSVDSLVSICNSCQLTYNSCLSNYYQTAANDQKGIIDLQAQNNILPELQKTAYRNSVLMSTTQTVYNTFQPNVTQPASMLFSTTVNPLETRIQYLSYDAHSKIKQVRKPGDFSVSYLWDYNNEYPVAEVKGADTASIAYTSFEADGTGNWICPSVIRLAGGTTGNFYYDLGNGQLSKTGLTPGASYVVSYWSTGGAYSVNGGSATTVTGKTINGWTYYEMTVTASAGTLAISGAGGIDELRLYPKGAQMATYTYDPLIGMTSSSDMDERITYYVYDALGRLSYVKDQDGNIIKTMEYHYKGQ